MFGACYDWLLAPGEVAFLAGWRRDLLEGLTGRRVLELGAGTGANLPHYPPGVDLALTEPSEDMRRRLEPRAAARGLVPTADRAEALSFPDASFDDVVATLVFCSVRDVGAALAEVRRVLRPGGRLHFVEHVVGSSWSGRSAQRLIEPVWTPLAAGCHLTRDTLGELVRAGFTLESVDVARPWVVPPVLHPFVRGVAAPRA